MQQQQPLELIHHPVSPRTSTQAQTSPRTSGRQQQPPVFKMPMQSIKEPRWNLVHSGDQPPTNVLGSRRPEVSPSTATTATTTTTCATYLSPVSVLRSSVQTNRTAEREIMIYTSSPLPSSTPTSSNSNTNTNTNTDSNSCGTLQQISDLQDRLERYLMKVDPANVRRARPFARSNVRDPTKLIENLANQYGESLMDPEFDAPGTAQPKLDPTSVVTHREALRDKVKVFAEDFDDDDDNMNDGAGNVKEEMCVESTK